MALRHRVKRNPNSVDRLRARLFALKKCCRLDSDSWVIAMAKKFNVFISKKGN